VQEFLSLPENAWLKRVHQPLDFEEWVKRYPQSRRLQLRQARANILGAGKVVRADALVKNFIKRETTDSFVDPRNISPRTDGFLAVLGPYISAIEHQAIRSRYLVKGLTPKQRALKMSWLADYSQFVEVDYSRFDMTISDQIIRIFEHHILKAPFNQVDHPLFHQALDLTLRTVGLSSFGTRYQREGGRCSGDAHTSIANGLLNRFLTWVCLQRLPNNRWRSIHEGDDGIIAFNGDLGSQIRANLSFLHLLGFKAKLKFTRTLEEVIFCGRRHYFGKSGICEQAAVPRCLKKFNTTMTLGKNKVLLLAKAMSYNYTDANTPMIGALSYAIVKTLRDDPECASPRRLKAALAQMKAERWLLRDSGVSLTLDYAHNIRPPDVCPHARAACALADGLSFSLQEQMEKEYLGWIDLGYIPEVITKVHYDWQPDNTDIVVYGNIASFLL
jgi:hypothetical protein